MPADIQLRARGRRRTVIVALSEKGLMWVRRNMTLHQDGKTINEWIMGTVDREYTKELYEFMMLEGLDVDVE